ncbi:MAG TPA: TetR/AcrR family transcriptional regulator, partial [Solirubrobacterales bacterium]|nr:TetR/AcrR family transcriptional regulator [Solirubrobacterales bacterium]
MSPADRRRRLTNAMAETCAARGFAATTTTDVVAAAGVSREDFEELFRDEEECFLATVDGFLAEVMGLVGQLASPDKTWFQTTHDGFEALLRLFAERPTVGKVALLETLPAGPAAFERYSALKRMLVSLLDLGRADAPEDVKLPSAAALMAFGGAKEVITDELIAGHAARLPNMLPMLLYTAYAPFMDQAEALSRSGLDQVPRDWGAAPAAGAAHVAAVLPGPGPRTDLLEAMIKVSVVKGYEATTLDEVMAAAGVDREGFNRFFPDKQSCFLPTFDHILDHVVFGVVSAYETEVEWPDRVRVAVAALLDWFSAEPRMAHLAIVGMATAGPAAHRHYRKAVQRFLPLFTHGLEYAPLGDRLPPSITRLALG